MGAAGLQMIGRAFAGPSLGANFAAAVFTCACIVIGFNLYDRPEKLSAVGQLIGGWATTLAFFYIFHSFRIQENALVLQSQANIDEKTRSEEQHRLDQTNITLSSKTLSLELCQLARSLLQNQCILFYKVCRALDSTIRPDIAENEILRFLLFDYAISDKIEKFGGNPAVVAILQGYVSIYEKYEILVSRQLGSADVFEVYFLQTDEGSFLKFCRVALGFANENPSALE